MYILTLISVNHIFVHLNRSSAHIYKDVHGNVANVHSIIIVLIRHLDNLNINKCYIHLNMPVYKESFYHFQFLRKSGLKVCFFMFPN